MKTTFPAEVMFLLAALMTGVGACEDGREAIKSPSERGRDSLGGSFVDVGFNSLPQRTLDSAAIRIDGYDAVLTRITSLALSPQGVLAVPQVNEGRVILVGPDGDVRTTFGRQGEGPGEFLHPNRVGWMGDTLWVADSRLQRLSFYSDDGSLARVMMYRRAVPRPGDSHGLSLYLGHFMSPRAVYADGSRMFSVIGNAPDTQEGSGNALLIVSPADTIERLVLREPAPVEPHLVPFSNGNLRGAVPVPYVFQPTTVVSPDGMRNAVLQTAGDTFTLTVRDHIGTTQWRHQYVHPRRAVPAQVRDSTIAAASAQDAVQWGKAERLVADRLRERIPDRFPPVQDVFIANDGTIWVALWPRADGTRPWLRLTSSGDPIDIVTVASDVSLEVANSTVVWGIERDRLDVESLLAFPLEDDQ